MKQQKDVIQRLKLGLWFFRAPLEIPSGFFHVAVSGLLAAAALAFAIKDGKLNNLSLLSWPLPSSSPEKLRLVPGLQNHGNNCFLNVILQALASCVLFQPFLQRLMDEFELHEGLSESLPLTVSLAALLEDLSTVCLNRVVLSPRKVMHALAYYTPNFNLTSQQDAAEAFLHLLSSLKEEISDFNHPHQCSLVDAFASNGRIITSRTSKDYNELEKWQGHFLGPFDGILGSILTCQSCSSQISLSFESFHSLPLSPVLNGDSTMVAGCTLLDCLKQFIAAEKVENYRCSYCWHNAGVKYLSTIGAAEMEIEKLMMCDGQDCDCARLLHLEKIPWSNKFSCTLKQLSIAHCPKILCIHLKRVSMNVFGESLKLQGHISFPLILDLCPFMLTGVGIKDLEQQFREQQTASNKKPSHGLDFFRMQFDTTKLKNMYGFTGEDFARNLTSGESTYTERVKAFAGESSTFQTGDGSETLHSSSNVESGAMESRFRQITSSETCFYQLVSVVEHFGRAGSGHYTVYRRVEDYSILEQNFNGHFQGVSAEWFYISDSEVHLVSEKEVLAAEATLLFYEKY